jgi:hypothetical protein
MVKQVEKDAIILVKGCKSKDYVDVNSFMERESLKNKFGCVSAPSFIKMET